MVSRVSELLREYRANPDGPAYWSVSRELEKIGIGLDRRLARQAVRALGTMHDMDSLWRVGTGVQQGTTNESMRQAENVRLLAARTYARHVVSRAQKDKDTFLFGVLAKTIQDAYVQDEHVAFAVRVLGYSKDPGAIRGLVGAVNYPLAKQHHDTIEQTAQAVTDHGSPELFEAILKATPATDADKVVNRSYLLSKVLHPGALAILTNDLKNPSAFAAKIACMDLDKLTDALPIDNPHAAPPLVQAARFVFARLPRVASGEETGRVIETPAVVHALLQLAAKPRERDRLRNRRAFELTLRELQETHNRGRGK